MSNEGNVCQVGKVRVHRSEVTSTNDLATQLLRHEDPPEGLVITTDFQQDGRGQLQHAWISDPGKNILMSIIFYPTFLPVSKAFYLNKCFSLAIVETISLVTGLHAQVKWPNDIYVDDQKISGILIQNALQKDTINSSIVGIGLNINQTKFPSKLTKASSLSILCSRVFDREEVLKTLCTCLSSSYERLMNNPAALDLEYEQRLYRKGSWSLYLDILQQPFSGKIECVEADGRLKILTKTGEFKSFAHSEISFV